MFQTFPASIDALQSTKNYVQNYLSDSSWTDKSWELPLEEAVMNIIQHAGCRSFELTCQFSETELKLILKHQGIHYNPHLKNGYGLMLINALTDQLHYHHQDGYNQLTLIKGK